MSTLVQAAGSEHFCGRTNQGELRSSEQVHHLDHSKGYHESLSIMICFQGSRRKVAQYATNCHHELSTQKCLGNKRV